MSLEHYSIVFDREPNGVHTAYVAGLPVYTAADTRVQCERGIIEALTAHLMDTPTRPRPAILVKTATVTRGADQPPRVRLGSVAVLLGAKTSRRKAATSRANGRKGGRPRKTTGERG